MTEMTTTTIRIESDIKDQATEIFKKLGLNFNAGIDIYLRAVVREEKIPFDLALPRQKAK